MCVQRLWSLVLLLFAVCFACSNPPAPVQDEEKVTKEEVMQKAKDAFEALKTHTSDRQDDYVKAKEAALADVTARIEELRGKVEGAEADLKAELQEHMTTLQKKRQVVHQEIEALKTAGATAWEDMKARLEGALTELDKTYEQTRERLK